MEKCAVRNRNLFAGEGSSLDRMPRLDGHIVIPYINPAMGDEYIPAVTRINGISVSRSFRREDRYIGDNDSIAISGNKVKLR